MDGTDGVETVETVDTADERVDVRRTRHAATRTALLSAALQLFDRHGFAAATVEEIAAAAGVSRRTAYRRFRSKEDILLELPRRWLEVFDHHLAEHPEATGRVAIEGASLAVSAHIDDHRTDTLIGLRALAEAPGLNAASVARDDWHQRIARLLVADGDTAVDAEFVAGAYLGAIDSMLAVWATSDPPIELVELNRAVNQRLRPIWAG